MIDVAQFVLSPNDIKLAVSHCSSFYFYISLLAFVKNTSKNTAQIFVLSRMHAAS